MGKLSSVFSAKTGLEWALFVSAPFFLAWGAVTGTTILAGPRGGLSASTSESSLLFWGVMVFHALCCIGLFISLRRRRRNKGRWFPED